MSHRKYINFNLESHSQSPRSEKVVMLGSATEILNRNKPESPLKNKVRKFREKFSWGKKEISKEKPEVVEINEELIAESLVDEIAGNKEILVGAVNNARELQPDQVPAGAVDNLADKLETEEGRQGLFGKIKNFLKTSRGTKVAGFLAGAGAGLSLRLGARAVLGPNFVVSILAGATAGGLVEGTKQFIRDRKRYDGDEIEKRLEEVVLGYEVKNKISEDPTDSSKKVIIEKGEDISLLERAGIIAKAEEILHSGRVNTDDKERLIGLIANAKNTINLETQKPEFKDGRENLNEKKKLAFILKRRGESLDEKLDRSEKKEVKKLISDMESKFGKPEVSWKNVRVKQIAKAIGRGAIVGAGSAAIASLCLDYLMPSGWADSLSEKAQGVVEKVYGHVSPELTEQVKHHIVEEGQAHVKEVYSQMLVNAKEHAVNNTYSSIVSEAHGSITQAARDAVKDLITNVEHLVPGTIQGMDPAHLVAVENQLVSAKVAELGSSIVQPGTVLEFKGQAILDAINNAGNMTDSQIQNLNHFLEGRLSETTLASMMNHENLVNSGMNDYFTQAMQNASAVSQREGVTLISDSIAAELTKQKTEIAIKEANTKYFTAFALSAGVGYGVGVIVPGRKSSVEAKSMSGGYSKELSEDVDKVEQKNSDIDEKVTANTPGDNLENPNGTVNSDLEEKDTKSEKRVVKKEKKGTNKYSGEELDNLRANWEKLRKTKKPYVSWFESVEGLHKNEKEARTNLLADMQWVLISVEQEKLADIEVINFCLDDELKGKEANKGFSVGERGKRIYIGLSDREAMQARLKLAIEEARIQRDSETAKQESAEKRKKDITELRAEYNTHSIALIPGISIKTLNKGNKEEKFLANKAYEEIMKAGKEAGIFNHTDQIAGLVIQVEGYPPADSGVLSEKGFFIQDRSKENDGKINLEIVYPSAGTEKLAVLFKDALDSIKKRRPKKKEKEKEVFEPISESELNLDKIVRIIDAGIDQYSNQDREKYNELIKARTKHEEIAKEKGLNFKFKQKIGGSYDSETSFPLLGAGDYKYEVIVPQEHEKNVETYRLAEQASALLYEGDDPLINLNNPEESKKITALVNTLQKRFSEVHHIDPFKQKETE